MTEPTPAAETEWPGSEAEPQPQEQPQPEDDAAPAPMPLGVPRTPTGNADVDAALERLADADHLDTASHLEVYEDAHARMREALDELDRRPGPPAPAGSGRP